MTATTGRVNIDRPADIARLADPKLRLERARDAQVRVDQRRSDWATIVFTAIVELAADQKLSFVAIGKMLDVHPVSAGRLAKTPPVGAQRAVLDAVVDGRNDINAVSAAVGFKPSVVRAVVDVLAAGDKPQVTVDDDRVALVAVDAA